MLDAGVVRDLAHCKTAIRRKQMLVPMMKNRSCDGFGQTHALPSHSGRGCIAHISCAPLLSLAFSVSSHLHPQVILSLTPLSPPSLQEGAASGNNYNTRPRSQVHITLQRRSRQNGALRTCMPTLLHSRNDYRRCQCGMWTQAVCSISSRYRCDDWAFGGAWPIRCLLTCFLPSYVP
jgi:hypothetical protein